MLTVDARTTREMPVVTEAEVARENELLRSRQALRVAARNLAADEWNEPTREIHVEGLR